MKPLTYYWQNINFVSVVLMPVSALFCLLVTLRRLLYQWHWFKCDYSIHPVIVVGNIYVGGNGKTPFVIWLAQELKKQGFKPGVVSRGYGAIDIPDEILAWPRRVELNKDSRLFGDEPTLIHQATGCPVVIDPVRSRAVTHLEQHTDCDVIISDDGMQHYSMARSIEINITDARRLYGNGLCLPAGPLRESRHRLKSVDFIVYNISQNPQYKIEDTFSHKAFFMDYLFQNLRALDSSECLDDSEQSMTLEAFKGKIVHAVAGIGEPDNFFKVLKQAGLTLIEHPFTDHHLYEAEDFAFGDGHPILMTEKDAVKCRDFKLTHCWYLPIKASIEQDLMAQITDQLKLYQAKASAAN